MKKKLTELISYIPHIDTKKDSISKATVGWHVHHALMVINGICLTLMRSKEENYTKIPFNFKKEYVLLMGKFPRGKAKSPTKVNTEAGPTREEIEKQHTHALKLLGKIETLQPKQHFKHAIFGVLNLKESKRFLQIHTEHHLKIIRDILS